MKQKDLLYIALAAAAGYYVGHYVVKADTTAKGSMGVSNRVSAHDGARLLGAWRAMAENQHLRQPTIALYKKYGVRIDGSPEDGGYSLEPGDRAYALAAAGGRGVKIGAVTNLAD